MKEYTLLANWKSWGSSTQIRQWAATFLKEYVAQTHITVVICPSFLHIPLVSDLFKDTAGIFVGAQELSVYQGDTSSGEVTIDLLVEYCRYYLVGHSFQRGHRDSTEAKIAAQLALISDHQCTAVLCAGSSDEIPLDYRGLSVYEPSEAISDGTGYGDTAQIEQIEALCTQFRQKTNNGVFYGGSVNEQNLSKLLATDVDGFLVGGASKDPTRFHELISLIAQAQRKE
jgi:triosephosphate isomerase (TIM)